MWHSEMAQAPPTSRPNGHRTVNLNNRRTYCSLETGAPEDDALSSTATSSPAKKECDTQKSLSFASTVHHLPPQLHRSKVIHFQKLYHALREALRSFAGSLQWSTMGRDLGGRSGVRHCLKLRKSDDGRHRTSPSLKFDHRPIFRWIREGSRGQAMRIVAVGSNSVDVVRSKERRANGTSKARSRTSAELSFT